jgi:hypothetical protein
MSRSLDTERDDKHIGPDRRNRDRLSIRDSDTNFDLARRASQGARVEALHNAVKARGDYRLGSLFSEMFSVLAEMIRSVSLQNRDNL